MPAISTYPPIGINDKEKTVSPIFFEINLGPKPMENDGVLILKSLQNKKCPSSWNAITNAIPNNPKTIDKICDDSIFIVSFVMYVINI